MVTVAAPNTEALLAPILPALPAAAASTSPPAAILPLLSPILRQRVQLLSSASTEPWIRLLSYDVSSAPKLAQAVASGRLEPHPISGEVEVDWVEGCEMRYRRLDQETLHALVVLKEVGLFFRLVYCAGDQEGGGDGWRIGEVGVLEVPSPLVSFDGAKTIAEAEADFAARRSQSQAGSGTKTNGATNGANGYHAEQSEEQAGQQAGEEEEEGEDEDDDDYWARYDATPARTPAVKRSPAPASLRSPQPTFNRTASAEDAYFAQYDTVQPAMDNHDPDEAQAQAQAQGQTSVISQPEPIRPAVAHGHVVLTAATHVLTPPHSAQPSAKGSADPISAASTNGSHGEAHDSDAEQEQEQEQAQDRLAALLHPRPASSASSNGSQTVAKLEGAAGQREASEFGVKQHVSRTIRSLFQLSRASGIDRDEFERIVRTEIDCLAMMGD